MITRLSAPLFRSTISCADPLQRRRISLSSITLVVPSVMPTSGRSCHLPKKPSCRDLARRLVRYLCENPMNLDLASLAGLDLKANLISVIIGPA